MVVVFLFRRTVPSYLCVLVLTRAELHLDIRDELHQNVGSSDCSRVCFLVRGSETIYRMVFRIVHLGALDCVALVHEYVRRYPDGRRRRQTTRRRRLDDDCQGHRW